MNSLDAQMEKLILERNEFERKFKLCESVLKKMEPYASHQKQIVNSYFTFNKGDSYDKSRKNGEVPRRD